MELIQIAKNVVRRSPSAMRFYRQLDTPLCKGMFTFDQRKMAETTKRNRALIADFGSWVDPEAMKKSIFQYGLSPEWASLIELPISQTMTYSDILAYAASQMPRDVSYLEIGVSVGKNFWQLLNQIENGFVTGVDIEDMNPPLERRLTKIDSLTIESNFQSPRKKSPRFDRFEFPERNNRVEYHAGDVFDPAVWHGLRGRKFNLIFSDAFHNPEAVEYEWKQLVDLKLIDESGFTIVWDDLVSRPIRRVFNDIASDCIRRFGLSSRNACLMHVSGWVGEHEDAHPIGIISSQGLVT